MLMDTVCNAMTDLMLSLRTVPAPEMVNLVHPRPVAWNAIFKGISEALLNHPPLTPFRAWLSKIEALSASASATDMTEVVRRMILYLANTLCNLTLFSLP